MYPRMPPYVHGYFRTASNVKTHKSPILKRYHGLNGLLWVVNWTETAAEQLGFSPRACLRVLKVSRTIADLDGKEGLQTAHLAEAIALRSNTFQLAKPWFSH